MGNNWEGGEETSLQGAAQGEEKGPGSAFDCRRALEGKHALRQQHSGVRKLQIERWDKPVSLLWSLLGSRGTEGMPQFWKKTCSAVSTRLEPPNQFMPWLYLQHLEDAFRASQHRALRIQNLPQVEVSLTLTLWSALRGFT